MVAGIRELMKSDIEGPTNIGSSEYVSVAQLVSIVADVARKEIGVHYIDGPVGVQSRNFSNERIYSTGWNSSFSLRDGIEKTYPWVDQQVTAAKSQR